MNRLVLCIAAALLLPMACSRTATPPPGPATAAVAASAAMPAMPAMPQMPASIADWARGAQLFDGLGGFHRGIATESPDAQRYFDQGMRFMWAFNHDEATRSFARAFEIDLNCAMCLWGIALTVGPNYNQPMMAEARAKVAFDSLNQAKILAERASPVDRALIGALEARYPHPTALDPSNVGPVLLAYANAMREVARQFPDDLDVQTMFAESLMNVNAWKLWSLDGKANPGTDEIVRVLESVLARDPQHPGANHYYVHALEASPNAAKAVLAAERLRGMMPAAGHLEHMPAHIMQRVGRYEDAAQANRNGAAADRIYLSRTRPLDYYIMYVAHNFQFLGYSTAMQGRKADTLAVMTELRSVFPESAMLAMPGTDWSGTEPYFALLRFGMWPQMLAEPRPDPALKMMTGGYLFATATALAASGRIAESKRALEELNRLRPTLPAGSTAGLNSAAEVLAVASMLAKAQIELAEKQRDAGIETLTEAVAMEDKLAYNEPADWFFPIRHLLGAELLKAGRNFDAEAVYREDLRRNPLNGWSLFGLSQALRAQKKTAEASRIQDQFNEAWKGADITLTSSVI